MASKYIHTSLVARLIALYETNRIVLRISGSITAIGKTLRAHIIMDRGLGFEVPIYWCRMDARERKRKYSGKIVDVKSVVNI
jgi:hypothetical protein